MKKLIVWLCVLLILFSFCSCGNDDEENVAAVVNGEEVLISTIEDQVEMSELSYETALEYINKSNALTQEQKAIESEKLSPPKNQSEILTEEIEKSVLYQEALKLGISFEYKDAYAEAEKNYNMLFQFSDSEENAATKKSIESFMKKNNLSEEEYLEYLANIYYRNAVINNLKEYFKEEIFDAASSESFDEQYSQYKQSLVKKADIKHIN